MVSNKKKPRFTSSGLLCAHCAAPGVITDALGFKWCEDHRFRGDLINLGAKYGYPDLECQPYAVGAGQHCWLAASIIGSNDLVWMALSALEYVEKTGDVSLIAV